MTQSEWIHARLPRFDDLHTFEVWDGSTVRTVRRVGNESRGIAPGTLVYTDCAHPLQNMMAGAMDVKAWRIKGPHEDIPQEASDAAQDGRACAVQGRAGLEWYEPE